MSDQNTPNPSKDGYINHNELKWIHFYIEYNPLNFFIMIGEHSYAIRSSVALATVTVKDKKGKHVQDTIPVFNTNWINKKGEKGIVCIRVDEYPEKRIDCNPEEYLITVEEYLTETKTFKGLLKHNYGITKLENVPKLTSILHSILITPKLIQ